MGQSKNYYYIMDQLISLEFKKKKITAVEIEMASYFFFVGKIVMLTNIVIRV